MILVFLVILGFLAYAIMVELEVGKKLPIRDSGRCPECGQEVEEDWLLCPRCRSLLKSTCTGCGHPGAVYHVFCPFCGIRNGGEAP